MNIIPTCKYEVQQILKAHYAQYFLNRFQTKKSIIQRLTCTFFKTAQFMPWSYNIIQQWYLKCDKFLKATILPQVDVTESQT